MVSQFSATPAGNASSVSPTPNGSISGITGSYAGRILSTTEEGGTKQAVIDFALGRMRVTLPPELAETLSEGDLLRLLFQGSDLRLEKKPVNQSGSPSSEKPVPNFPSQAVTFTPSGGSPVIRDLIDFEESLIRFLSAESENPSSPRGSPSLPGYSSVAKSSSIFPGALTPEALPVLLLRVLESPSGRDFLASQFRALNPDLLKSITTTLSRLDPPAVAGDPRNFVDLLRGFRSALSEAFTSTTVKSTFESLPNPPVSAGSSSIGLVPIASTEILPPSVIPSSVSPSSVSPASVGVDLVATPLPPPSSSSRDILRYLKPPVGSDLFLARGLILSREPIPPAPALNALPEITDQNSPLMRYRIDRGGTTVEVQSSEMREPGEFVAFQLNRLENQSEKSVARFRDSESMLPPVLRQDYATATPIGKAALLLAADHFKHDLDEPGFPEAIRDFSRLIVDTGRLQGPSASLPETDELDALFKLMLAFPRDAGAPSLQARAWGEVVRNPGGFQALLRLFRPEQGQALLDPQHSLRPVSPEMTKLGERPSWTPSPGELPLGFPPELPGLLEKALAQKSDSRPAALGAGMELRWDAAMQADRSQTVFESGSIARPVPAGGLEKFLHQAFTSLAPAEEGWKEGQSRTLYFFHGDEWKQLEANWASGSNVGGEKTSKPVDRPPVRVDISLQTENLGSVHASLSLDRKGSRLDFRSEYADARDLLAQSIHPLEHLLRDLDLRLASWTCTRLAKESPDLAHNDRSTMRSIESESSLDIFG